MEKWSIVEHGLTALEDVSMFQLFELVVFVG